MDIIKLIKDNTKHYIPPQDERELIIGGWKCLCETYAPIFLEKSPHHLYQWSAIELILECVKELENIDFLLIGLIRNPMDTIYSQFKRWKTRPEKLQYQWLVAYQNLMRLKTIMGKKLLIVRHEDMVSSLQCLQPVFDFCNVKTGDDEQSYLHQKSITKWKNDNMFGFALSEEVIALAESYGYQTEALRNRSSMIWPIYREYARSLYKSKRPFKIIARKGVKGIKNVIGI